MNDILQSVAMVNVIEPFFIRLFYAHCAIFLSLGTSAVALSQEQDSKPLF